MLLTFPIALVLSFAATAVVGPVERSETRVEIRGPVARVTVDRVVSSRSLVSQPKSTHLNFDIALPPGAGKLTIKVSELSKAQGNLIGEVAASAVVVPSDAPSIEASSLAAITKALFDPSANLRLAFDASGPSRLFDVTYAYTVPLSCREGWWQLELPGAVDLAPLSGNVFVSVTVPAPFRLRELRVAGKSWLTRKQSLRAKLETSGQMALPLAFQLLDVARRDAAGWSMMAVSKDSRVPPVLGVCRAAATATVSPPSVVIAVIDASRSVGVPGLSLQKEFTKSFLSALSVSTRFNVISFAADVHRLFPFARLPTQEAFSLLDQHLVPDLLGNGTRLSLALSEAAREVERELKDDPSANPWLLLIGDGSLPQSTTSLEAKAAATARVLHLPFTSVVLRPENEDKPLAPALRIYRNLAASGGGTFRSLTPPGVKEQSQSMVAEILGGGGWFDVRHEGLMIESVLGVGAGKVFSEAAGTRSLGNPGAISFRQRGISSSIPIRTINLPATWNKGADVGTMRPLTRTVLPSGREVLAVLLPVPPVEASFGGELERSVLRNALSLQYLPRARACYLNRSASNARMRDLQGKVRLSLEIERGEMISANLLSTTLDSPDIEKCLLQAAFALNIPRPLSRDAPVEAILNLVFRPATIGSTDWGSADASLLDQELEVLLGPRHVLDTADDLGEIPGN